MTDEEHTYKLRFHTYSGMQIPLTTGDMDKVRAYAAKYLRTRLFAKAYEISIIERGTQWEIQTASNVAGLVVTDEDGILQIHP